MSTSTTQAYSPVALLNENEWHQLNAAVSGLSPQQLTWASGYLAGLAQVAIPATVAPVVEAKAEQTLTVLYGSQTGNAKAVATQYAEQAKSKGFDVKLVNMADYKPKNIKNETHIAILVSTHGEGDAPDDAVQLHEFLGSKKAPKLDNLKYAVLGLGDSSYEFFCQTAKDFDERLAKLGATAMTARVDCDVDYDQDAETWAEAVNSVLKEEFTASSVVPMPGVTLPAANTDVSENAAVYTKKNPYSAELIESQKITGRDSVKDIRHIEISLEDSGIEYKPGDALGVWFLNDAVLVTRLLSALSIDASEQVTIKNETLNIADALKEKLELTQSYPTFVQKYAQFVANEALDELLADKSALREYLAERQIIDVVLDYPGSISAQQLVDSLRPLMPRLYSIASSQAEVDEEVHLTVATVEFEQHGFTHQGGASGFLGHRLEEGQEVKVYVESNQNFRLPENGETPVIMIGPGTGIAPFRAFMQEREAQEAEGKNWLFFGNPNFTQDFLYQVEWQRFLKEGVLDKISLAFSRDQKEKIYVQHRILEEGEQVFAWLEEGAHVYVCGDANRMAKDVNDALVAVVAKHGNKSHEEAEHYVNDLRRNKRYQKDVY
ncbi:MAG: assimilatory sulfite reductase (NADPH) flavoprotein subunit [Alteromonadaceae bacterium]|nr:assimilatory sulfite reductase (NADPH) flavoprotein subunit [Alteromonadaceae bacterium]